MGQYEEMLDVIVEENEKPKPRNNYKQKAKELDELKGVLQNILSDKYVAISHVAKEADILGIDLNNITPEQREWLGKGFAFAVTMVNRVGNLGLK